MVERRASSCRPYELYRRESPSPGRVTPGGKVVGESSRLTASSPTPSLREDLLGLAYLVSPKAASGRRRCVPPLKGVALRQIPLRRRFGLPTDLTPFICCSMFHVQFYVSSQTAIANSVAGPCKCALNTPPPHPFPTTHK